MAGGALVRRLGRGPGRWIVKVQPSVKRRCEKCKVVKRRGVPSGLSDVEALVDVGEDECVFAVEVGRGRDHVDRPSLR